MGLFDKLRKKPTRREARRSYPPEEIPESPMVAAQLQRWQTDKSRRPVFPNSHRPDILSTVIDFPDGAPAVISVPKQLIGMIQTDPNTGEKYLPGAVNMAQAQREEWEQARHSNGPPGFVYVTPKKPWSQMTHEERVAEERKNAKERERRNRRIRQEGIFAAWAKSRW